MPHADLCRRIPMALAFAVFLSMNCAVPHAGRAAQAAESPVLRAGTARMDISPREFPVIVNGGMLERSADRVVDPLHARALVLDDGTETIAIVVVDSCMMPRSLLDEAKRVAEEATGIAEERMLISATHTHSAPAAMACLGSDSDARYSAVLPLQIARTIELAAAARAPARIGWAIGRDEKNVACRRWLMKPGTAATNPFGGTKDDQAQMHPGNANQNAVRPTGQVDPEVGVLAVQTVEGQLLAFFSNYSMHYVGAPAVSADYFAAFCEQAAQLLGHDRLSDRFVAALANGTSGDAWCMDYAKPRREFDRFSVAADVAAAAVDAFRDITWHDWVPLVMCERKLALAVRLPSRDEVSRAREFLASVGHRKPENVPEVYARETILLSEMPPTRELKLQAVRIGELGIAAIPNEVFGSTGLYIKQHSPLKPTINISLANGAEGYIPPPDQHALGGYTTWRARTSCLETEAEPRIARVVLELLDEVHHRRRGDHAAREGR
jgi:hypothetical protein